MFAAQRTTFDSNIAPRPTPAGRSDLPVSMVEKMTLILDAFDGRGCRLTLEAVARRTHLPRSTAHRILDQLVKLSWLDHSSFGYTLGRRALGGVAVDAAQFELRAATAPRLHELLMQTGMVVHLAVLDRAEVHYLDKAGGRFAAAVPSRVGGRAPAHCTALGKAMLAWLKPEQVDALYCDGIGIKTSRTIAELGLLHQELARIRQRGGLAFEAGECFENIACVAAAIRGSDGPVGAISLVSDREAPTFKVAPLVLAAARRVSDTFCSIPGQQIPGQSEQAVTGR